MHRIPWSVTLAVFVLTSAVIALGESGPWWQRLLVGVIAALATVVGAMCAPAHFGRDDVGAAELRRRKQWQLVIAGATTAVLGRSFLDSPGVAAIFGIVAAMFVGALWPRENVARDTTDADAP